MGHQALAMEMEHLGKQWQLPYFSIAPHRFGSTVRRVYASVFTFPYDCQIPILTCSDMSLADTSVLVSGRARGPTCRAFVAQLSSEHALNPVGDLRLTRFLFFEAAFHHCP